MRLEGYSVHRCTDCGSISGLLADHGFEVVHIAPDETVRGLLNESALVRAGVSALFAAARVLGLRNKMAVIARPA